MSVNGNLGLGNLTGCRRRILFYAENSVVGGAERYVRDLVRSLVGRGYEVRIGCNASPDLETFLRGIHPSVPVDVLPIRTITGSAAFQLGQKTGAGRDPRFDRLRSYANAAVSLAHLGPNAIVLQRWLRKHQPDVFHINNGGYPGGESCRAATVAARLARVPVVSMFVHSQAGPRRWPRWEEAAMDRLVSSCLATMLAPSQAVTQTLVYQRGFPRRQIACIPNGIEPPDVSSAPESRESLGLPSSGLLVGVVGRLDANKGQGYLLEAAARVLREMDDVNFVIVGSGPSEEDYRALAIRLGIAGHTAFTGWRSDVVSILRTLDVFAMPTLDYEGFGYALLEAMSVGLPVVVTRVGGMPEVVQGGQAGLLVEPRNVDALASALLHLLRDPEERQRLSAIARARVQSEYTIERMVERTVDHYIRLLGTAM